MIEVKQKKSEFFLFRDLREDIRYIDITSIDGKKFKNNSVVSLFTGAGGLDLGLEDAGFRTLACVEIDPDCRETLRYNRPEWKLFEENFYRIPGDIRNISPEELWEFANGKSAEIALVVGGAPCQPFSNIGKRKGLNDPENGDLFYEFVRIVKGINPTAFLFENVSGIAQTLHLSVINFMKEELERIGYNTSYTILNSADYGVGQIRKRFFLVGIKDSKKPAFPLPTHSKNDEAWNQLISRLDKKPDYTPLHWVTLNEVLSHIGTESESRDDFVQMNISKKVRERMKLVPPGKNFKVLPMEMRPDCWKNGKHQGQDTFGRLCLDAPSVTIRTSAYNPAKGRYIHPVENRGLNSIEMAAIQGFPLVWTFKRCSFGKMTLKSVGRQIGNAVPPPLAKALGLAIKIQLQNL